MGTDAAAAQRAEELQPLTHRRWMAVAEAQNAAFMKLLRSLDQTEWAQPTECEPWSVKDMAAHVLGTAELFTSFSEIRRQVPGAWKRKAELGNQLNAMNDIQVEDRRGLSTDDLLSRLDDGLARCMRLRRRVGGVGKVLPVYDSSVLGLTTARYLFDTILCRDAFMHRVDISRAVGRPVDPIPEDRDLVADIVRDWTRRAKPDIRLDLSGLVGGSFISGSGAARIAGDAVEFCRFLSGRGSKDAFSIDGDRRAAEEALSAGCPF